MKHKKLIPEAVGMFDGGLGPKAVSLFDKGIGRKAVVLFVEGLGRKAVASRLGAPECAVGIGGMLAGPSERMPCRTGRMSRPHSLDKEI